MLVAGQTSDRYPDGQWWEDINDKGHLHPSFALTLLSTCIMSGFENHRSSLLYRRSQYAKIS